jgi:hypothetical protein
MEYLSVDEGGISFSHQALQATIHTGRVSVSKREVPFVVRLRLKAVSVGQNKPFYNAMLHFETKNLKRQT